MHPTKSTFCLLILITQFFLGCTRPHYESTPNGNIDTGERRFYPTFEVVRGKKNLFLPLDFQGKLVGFYRQKGYWPSLRTFAEESSKNKESLQRLYQQGFTWLEFIPVGTDTLTITFIFETTKTIKFDEEVGLDVHNTLNGQFLFVAKPTGEIICQKQIDSRKKSH